MAYRLAKAGLRVCLLERGKPYPPGSFPRSPYRMKTNFWDPSKGMYGLFSFWSFQSMNALVASGLGGGSLIYSNVMIRKDEKWFVHENLSQGGYENWPVTRAELDPHYQRVEDMLPVQRYPFDQAPYNKTPRTLALKAAAEELQLDWCLPNIAVTFGNADEPPAPGVLIHEAYPNIHGPNSIRTTCCLCSECNIGCNTGSKNTLDYNYLTEAKRHGAEIRTGCEVRSFQPENDSGYSLSYVEHDLSRQGQPTDTHDPAVLPPKTITTKRLILSAGALGSTYLLLKNRSVFPQISRQLGTRFSGNGDFLSFVVRCDDSTSGERIPRIIDPSYGPAITSTIRIPDKEDGGEGRGFYIQDAGYPEFVNWMLQLFDEPGALGQQFGVVRQLIGKQLKRKTVSDVSKYVSKLFGACELSAGLLPLDGMGRDIPSGKMRLRQGKLELSWPKEDCDAYYEAVRQKMIEISRVLGGDFVDDPLWYLNRVITVHPLGGCPMGRNSTEGVVNEYGEVFNYPNFYIADGSVMPGPVGANPSLTIAALADRFASGIIEGRGGKNA